MFFFFRKIKLQRNRRPSLGRKKYMEHREVARKIANNRVEYFSKLYGVSVNRIAIRNSKSRWGSCSKKGNLNFNYKIVFLDPNLIDYIIVHEICHLLEFNHSANFWLHVGRVFPNHKILRKELRKMATIYR